MDQVTAINIELVQIKMAQFHKIIIESASVIIFRYYSDWIKKDAKNLSANIWNFLWNVKVCQNHTNESFGAIKTTNTKYKCPFLISIKY